MTRPLDFADQPLRGKRVMLSAAMPELADDFNASSEDPLNYRVQEAIIDLARAVFSFGGQLVVSGDFITAALVMQIAGEYLEPRGAEDTGKEDRGRPPAILGRTPENDRSTLELLAKWTGCEMQESWSTERLIRQMNPKALICIGGRGQVLSDAQAFRRILRDRSIFAIADAGGDAALLGSENTARANIVHYLDDSELREARYRLAPRDESSEKPAVPGYEDFKYVPFPLLMQRVVGRIIADDDESHPSKM